ncbi:hypothetical protein SLS62_010719 [Diatrype stigma]|uniref:Laccase n=1 Tax=Diatrype stigma TaxID=117547 RepID=A0AAN9UA77_9PEZI
MHLHDASSFTPDAVLHISVRNISIGGINRYSTLINDSLPAPELRLPEGEVVWIRVYNDMTDQNTTIHWHGLAQAASPFSDGTPLASQWPIPPQHFFDYELQLPNGSAGTYFYHSHVGFQAVTAAGPLIVEDRAAPPYQTDGERTVFVHGLWNETDAQVEQGVNDNPLAWPGETNGILINGKTISDSGVVDDATAGLAVIEVDPASTYRLRFVGSTALSYTALAFEAHGADVLRVVEADGHYTQPAPAPEGIIQIGGGQRFSALLDTKSCDELRDLGRLDFYIQTETRERTYSVTNYAILRYSADACGSGNSTSTDFADPLPTDAYPAQKPIDMPPTINGYLDYALRPLEGAEAEAGSGFPSAAEVTRRVVLNAQVFEDGYYMWRDSNVSWGDSAAGAGASHHTVPYAPYLVGLYRNDTAYLPDYDAAVANGGVDPRTQTFPARIGEVLEVVIQNLGADSRTGAAAGLVDVHPFHAHGGHI